MFQILSLWNDISYSIVKSLYGTVMRAYEFIGELAHDDLALNFASFAASIYVLAGVFMLFRTVIGLLQMLVNPDQVSDKQAGAGKLLTRIVVALILLILFQPSGFLLGEDGLMNKIQNALLAEDGLVNNIISSASVEEDDKQNQEGIIDENTIDSDRYAFGDYFIENVYADSNWSKTCYFYKTSWSTGGKKNGTTHISEGIKIMFSGTKKSGYKKVENTNFYAKVVSGKDGDKYIGKDEKTHEASWTKITLDKYSRGFLNTFPKAPNKVSNCSNWYLSNSGGYGSYKLLNPGTKKLAESDSRWRGNNNWAGYLDKVANDVKKAGNDNIDGDDVSQAVAADTNANVNDYSYTEAATDFGTALVSCFEECVNSDSGALKQCEKAKEEQFNTSDSSEIVSLIEKNDINFSWIMAIIAGIGVLIYLILLSVEIILRGLKLAFLELLAPIPITCYVDPKDKIFNQWLKMYIATYLDLFIKLLALGIAIAFLDQVIDADIFAGSLFKKFLVIIAILIFAKAVPTMVSKIFGLDNMGGSMKDIGNMMKKGATMAAGAGIGGAVGFVTGKGFGKVTGALGGALRGVGSGSKGNVLGGAQSISKYNDTLNRQKADKLKLKDRLLIGASNATGVPLSGGKAQEQMKLANAVNDKRKSLDSWAGDELRKKGATISVVGKTARIEDSDGTIIAEVQNAILSKDKSKVVTAAGEGPINMKIEYSRQEQLNGMTLEQWDRMDSETKIREFGEHIGSIKSLTSAKVEMNDRIAALEDYGKAERINIALRGNDEEAIKIVGELRDSITDANNGGVAIDQVPDDNRYDNKTLKNAKDQANKEFNRIGEENAQALKRSKYVSNNK